MTEEHWEEETVEAARPVAIVVSVRVPQEIAERLQAVAKRRSVSISTVVRDAVEAFLDAPDYGVATAGLTITVAEGAVSFVSGKFGYVMGQSIGALSRSTDLAVAN